MKKSDLKITGKILSKEEYKQRYSENLKKKLGKYNKTVQDLQRKTKISYYGIWKIVNGEAMPNLYNAYLISNAFREWADDSTQRE